MIAIGSTQLFNVNVGTGPSIKLDCIGTESRLFDCAHLPNYFHWDLSCDMGVQCLATSTSGE